MAHVHEKIDFTVSALIVYKNKVLLRKHDKYNVWTGPGGHIDLDEDPNQAVVREAKEEVGLDIKLWRGAQRFDYPKDVEGPHRHLILPVWMHRHHTSPTHEHIDFSYFATSENDKVVPESPTDEWRWLAKNELGSLELLPDIKFYASKALDTLEEK